jgi:hypothetical protein
LALEIPQKGFLQDEAEDIPKGSALMEQMPAEI